VKPQVPMTQAAKPQSVSKQQIPQMSQVARSQTQLQPRTATVQPTLRTPQVTQPISQKQQIAQINRKLYPNVLPS